jgi:nucleotidyltransferase substrate binding protein (TIGR01987 family)
MENLKIIRWKQRFENFEKSFLLLKEFTQIKKPSKIERAGGIQFFEMSFKLAWKVLKDYLESEGFEPKSPKATLKQAFQSNLVEDGHIWMDALDDRNLTIHTYDEETAEEIEFKIKNEYFFILEKLYKKLKEHIDKYGILLYKRS